MFKNSFPIYDVEDLWRVADSMEPYALDPESLSRFLDSRAWGRREAEGYGQYSPRDVLRYAGRGHLPKDIEDHLRRIEEADLRFPIILFRHEGKLDGIVDGFHRLLKATRDKRSLLAVEITDDDLVGLTPTRIICR